MTEAAAAPAKRALPLGWALLVFLFSTLFFAGAVLTPPAVRGANAADQFDANAARARLARVLGDETPHPGDSAAQDRTRAALLAEIEALGFAPEVRERFVCRPQPRSPTIECAWVRNIVFAFGPDSGPAVLAATHYDSVPAGPGASDAGIGIAAWLEVVRILSREQLTRRVIVLISDAEEQALLGAVAFADETLFQDVEALVNLEARGTRGPAMFFETGVPNADAVNAFAGAPRGVANSVMADAYRLLPNSTDVTVLTRPGLDIVNVALLDGVENYHTPRDSLASFDTRSLQHMGDTALHVMRRLTGAADAGSAKTLVYTDIASLVFVSAPSWAGQAALVVAVLLTGLAWWRGGGSRWRALVAPLAALVLACAVAAAIGFGLETVRAGETYWFAYPEAARAWCILAALLGVVTALTLLRPEARGVGAASWLWFSAIGLGASFALPGLSILFALPALLYALGAAIGLRWAQAGWIGAVLAGLLTLLIWAPTLFLVELSLGYAMAFAVVLLMALAVLTWAGPLMVTRGVGRGTAFVLGLALVGAVTAAALAPSASVARPAPLNVVYFADADADVAFVLAGSARRDLPAEIEAAAEFAPRRILPGDGQDSWAAPVERVAIPTPQLEELRVTPDGARRIIGARLVMNGAYRATIRIPRAARPVRAVVNSVGVDFADTGGPAEPDFYSIACQGRDCDGADVVVELAEGGEAGEWFVIGQTPGLTPAPAEAVQRARPETAIVIQFGDAAVSLSRVRVER